MKIIRIAGRIIVGLVFMFSGFVKAIDPMGFTYKFHDYFQAFHLGFLDFLSLPLSIFFCTIEFIAGLSVLSGIRQKEGIWVVMILMMIFTPLTLILALTNPVSDCGCFGDAIHLTNWQTFGKNIILVPFVLILFFAINSKSYRSLQKTEWAILSSFVALFVIFCFSNLRYLPVMDFLPYKTGTNIPEKMIIPEGMPVNEYKTTFIYEKDGLKKEFTLDNYPADDTSWVFVDQVSVLVKKGYQPPINDLSITTVENEDLTDKILSDKGYSLLLISTKLKEADDENLQKGFELGSHCNEAGINFYVITSSVSDEVKDYSNGLLFCTADEITLKTMVRSNPGYILLREGNIVGKWSWANVPENDWFKDEMAVRQIEKLHNRNSLLYVILIAVSFSMILLLIGILLKNRIYYRQ
ncbi:MAG TPA: BT_3928 family protein [Bacteroidales bacterium]|nr:BT_3928 family protein [Bacteroidales bacterium]